MSQLGRKAGTGNVVRGRWWGWGGVAAAALAFTACKPPPDTPPEEPPAPGVAEAPDTTALDFAGRLAVTFDDLPWVGPLPPGEDRLEATTRLLGTFVEHGVPAMGFVDCARVEPGAPALHAWLDGGYRLGNHTEDHVDLDAVDPSVWAGAAERCDTYLRELTGETPIWFRYPYLHRGQTPERYRAGMDALALLEAPIAPVTIVTLDWVLAGPYARALRAGETERASEIGEALVEHVVRAAEHYRDVSHERVGRDVAHVLLLHANALAVDHAGEVFERLRAEGFEFVPLEWALEDPVYALPDDYVGPEGLSWLYRFEPAAPELVAWDEEELERLRSRYPR